MNSRIDSSSFHSFEEDHESNIEQQYQDHDIESANKLIAMNPSGVVEAFETERKLKCEGDVCVLEDEDEGRENMANKSDPTSSSSMMKYVSYVLLFLILCVILYFGYKKFFCAS
jgi:hypothetical protein